MEKTFAQNMEKAMMTKLLMEKAMYNRPKLSRREQEIKRDSLMRYVYFGNGYFVRVHKNQNREDIKGCEYLSPKYRYAEEISKRIR